MSMGENSVRALMSTVDAIVTGLDAAPDSWRDHLQSIRNITAALEFGDTLPDESRKRWQLPLLTAFQRVAYADADAGGVSDIANWCLKQAVTLLQVYPEDVELLTREPFFMSVAKPSLTMPSHRSELVISSTKFPFQDPSLGTELDKQWRKFIHGALAQRRRPASQENQC